MTVGYENYLLNEKPISYNTIISVFLTMVKKTIVFENLYLSSNTRLYDQLYPLLEEAKLKLLNYYKKFLFDKINKNNYPYLVQFLDYFEDQ